MKAISALGVSFVVLPAIAVSLQLLSQPDSSFAPSLSGGGDSTQPILSEDGRFVLFASTANNLAPGTNNLPLQAPLSTCLNVYLRDRASNTTTLVSVNLTGTGGGDRDAWPAGISTNGQFAPVRKCRRQFCGWRHQQRQRRVRPRSRQRHDDSGQREHERCGRQWRFLQFSHDAGRTLCGLHQRRV